MTRPSDPTQPGPLGRDPDVPPLPTDPEPPGEPPTPAPPDEPTTPIPPPEEPPTSVPPAGKSPPPTPGSEPDPGAPPQPGRPGDPGPLPPPEGQDERPLPPPPDTPFTSQPPPPPGMPGSATGSAPVPGPGGTTLVNWPLRAQSAIVDWFGPGVIAAFFQFTDIYWVLALGALIWAFYNAWLAGESGQSYGRKWAGTRLVRETDGAPLGGPMGVVRHVAHFLDAVICFVGFLFPLWDTKRQTIADKIVGSVVVKA